MCCSLRSWLTPKLARRDAIFLAECSGETRAVAESVVECDLCDIRINRAGFVALTKACEIWDRIGRDRIASPIWENAARLRWQSLEHWGEDSLYSPRLDLRLQSGVISFTPLAKKTPTLELELAKTFVEKVERHCGFVVKEVPFPQDSRWVWAIRVTPHFWHDQLVEGMRHITSTMS